jgi:ribose transport system permease protein
LSRSAHRAVRLGLAYLSEDRQGRGLVTRFRVAPFVATLGTMSIFRSLTLYCIDAGEYRSASEAYARIGAGSFAGLFVPIWLLPALAALLQVVLTRTRYGRYVVAVGASEQVARDSAIRVQWVRFGTYVITGFTVGVTAVMFGSRLNAVSLSNMGLYYEIDAIAAVVIGGTSMAGGAGTVLGAVILGIINNMLNMTGVSPYLQGTVKGVVIIVAAELITRDNAARPFEPASVF